MNKKMIGFILAILLIGSMVVIMVKSNTDTAKPIDDFLIGADFSSLDEEPGLKKGDIPPDFELSTLTGEVVKLSNLKGKKVILNFWASWCGPCKAEMPHMQKYYKKYKDKDNVEIIAVNLTTAEKRGMKGVEEFVNAYGLTFPIPLDKEGTAMDDYRIIPIPTTFMIGTDGKISQKIVGPMDEKSLRNLVKNLD
ncbi:redoxin domain-containing protein [Sporosarcina sp. ANT_H38]|uniref:redoxin domain-containing protein n=1 Tax=Sporosarcina sp. ANT_H38 TaxID=2597358 RepID=UPI0011F157B3|nr:redoxin domain-containing protein [Sporosarcina sp. ANT_H38]KAA0966757.1 redoxin domain-containing protein [Sporosarcina sp. ANT_H38]